MSLTPHELEPIPQATRRLMHKACPYGTLATRLRDGLGPISRDEDFADLFAKGGRPAEARFWAGNGAAEALDGELDRSASRPSRVLALRLEICAPSGSPPDEGFDESILCDFGERLISHHAQERLLAPC